MKPQFNYQLIPRNFAYCLNERCKKANECLRFQATRPVLAERDSFTIVNPAKTSPGDEECRFFKADKLQPFAQGIKHLLDHVSHSDAIIIKQQMLDHFGKTLFYRFWRGENLVTPAQQEYIRQLFLNRNITEPPVFDEYIEMYEW